MVINRSGAVPATTTWPGAAGGPGDRYLRVRQASEALCAPLEVDDYMVQSMPDASPAKWHLAHTTWFFERFVLTEAVEGYKPFDPQFNYLFNSYYNTVGAQHCRPRRGLLSRPTVAQVYAYRRAIDEAMRRMLQAADERAMLRWQPVIEIGLHHEQQHQELLLTDIKHAFGCNPLRPAYRPRPRPRSESGDVAAEVSAMRWVSFDEEIAWIGHGGDGFAYDNESPRHRVLLHPFAIASRLVTAGEYLAFMNDGGYRRPELWLSEGWSTVQAEGWEAPLYWELCEGRWRQMTLAGMQEVDEAEPVCHVSYFEADAFARWAGARLPTEFEWERASQDVPVGGQFSDGGEHHPQPAREGGEQAPLQQMFGEAWQWTGSAYVGYPGYRPPPGALGEYNGKFMCNQFVLRGGSCATPSDHIRRTYRNFFPPAARWQFSGIRLAKDAGEGTKAGRCRSGGADEA